MNAGSVVGLGIEASAFMHTLVGTILNDVELEVEGFVR